MIPANFEYTAALSPPRALADSAQDLPKAKTMCKNQRIPKNHQTHFTLPTVSDPNVSQAIIRTATAFVNIIKLVIRLSGIIVSIQFNDTFIAKATDSKENFELDFADTNIQEIDERNASIHKHIKFSIYNHLRKRGP